jgi:hypothetical protein
VRNLIGNPRCCVTTEDASDPVIIEGMARIVADIPSIQRVVDLMNAKYHSDITLDFLDPEKNATIGVRPRRVFSMLRSDFTGSATRWSFDDET